MYTIVESEVFKGKVGKIWAEDERLAFFSYLAQNPLVGDVIKGAQGLRKSRLFMSKTNQKIYPKKI